VRLRSELEEAQRLRVDVDELRQYCRQLEAESGRWKCSSCTFINQARNAACEMCSVANPSQVAAPVPSGGAGGGGGSYGGGGGGGGYQHGGGGGGGAPRSGGRPGSAARDHGIVGLPGM
jgi:hypothetical protein